MTDISITCDQCSTTQEIGERALAGGARCRRCRFVLVLQSAVLEALYSHHRDAGLEAHRQRQFDDAIERLGRAAQLRPDLAEAHLNIGRAFREAGKIEAARHAFRQVKRLDRLSDTADNLMCELPAAPPVRSGFHERDAVQGTMVGTRFTIERVLQGGFGAVYIAVDAQTQERVALKTFQAQNLWRAEERQRFLREARTWIGLDHHPRIVTAKYVDEIEGFPCLVLEYVPGGDLAEMLAAGPLSIERAIELALQVCDALGFAHDRYGLVHRDVKPSNCLMTAEGDLKVSDFGLARTFAHAQQAGWDLGGSSDAETSNYTMALGTPQYMAPEQFNPAAPIDTRVDVHALGVMLYEMSTGDLPLSGSIAQAHIEANAEPFELPAPLLELILRCVDPQPHRRPGGFAILRTRLAAIYRELIGTAEPLPAVPLEMSAGDWLSKGLAWDSLGHHEEAIDFYDRALDLDNDFLNAWWNKAAALNDLGRYTEAIDCADRALEIRPGHAGVLANKGNSLRGMRHFDEALECYELALETDPESPFSWQGKCLALEGLEDFEGALNSIDRAIELGWQDASFWRNRSRLLRSLERYEDAVTCCDQGLQISPRSATLWREQGLAYQRLDRHMQALDCFDRSLEIESRDADVWIHKSVSLLAVGHNRETVECCDRGLALAPEFSSLWYNKALALRQLEQLDESLEAYQKVLDLDPRDGETIAAMARIFDRQGRFESALDFYDLALEFYPDDNDLAERRSQVALRLAPEKVPAAPVRKTPHAEGSSSPAAATPVQPAKSLLSKVGTAADATFDFFGAVFYAGIYGFTAMSLGMLLWLFVLAVYSVLFDRWVMLNTPYHQRINSIIAWAGVVLMLVSGTLGTICGFFIARERQKKGQEI